MVSSMKENLGLTVMHLQFFRLANAIPNRIFLGVAKKPPQGHTWSCEGTWGAVGPANQVLRVVDTPGWSSDPQKMEKSFVIFLS